MMDLYILIATALMGKIIPAISGGRKAALLGSTSVFEMLLTATMLPIGLLFWEPIFWAGVAVLALGALGKAFLWAADILMKWDKFNPCDFIFYIPLIIMLVVYGGWISYITYMFAIAIDSIRQFRCGNMYLKLGSLHIGTDIPEGDPEDEEEDKKGFYFGSRSFSVDMEEPEEQDDK